jgi:DNA end-binding protein Ku
VHVVKDALVLELMRFANEIVPVDEYQFPGETGVRPGELAMARQLLETLKSEFDPAKYTNEYRANLMRIIKAKSKGKAAKLKAVPEEKDDKVLDLMARLQASLKPAKRKNGKQPARRTAA